MLAIFCFGIYYAQTENPGQMFELKANTNATYLNLMKGIGPDMVTVPGTHVMVTEKVLFIVQSVDKGNNWVRFYARPYSDGPAPTSNAFYYNDKLFEMTYTDYKANAKDAAYPDRINFGIITLPFKYRPQKGAGFDTEFNLNAAFGYLVTPKYFRKTRLYIQGGAGIGTVGLDSSNSKATDSQDVSIITGFAGLMVQYNDVQAGIYFGADKINNNQKFDWEHQGNLWMSLGVGFKIFTLSKSDKS
ncbi:hypothetical protein HYN49_07695 [Flavobacterium pallidum]|uniref:Uncharacterized protein n=2 Tax=Flavobacterium pallidum TaxID=2172098 RepID=A0A2S1SHA5_9FLAO|nr:hypothetical protein HYN49_07695 [Flavobacterium pallidum]